MEFIWLLVYFVGVYAAFCLLIHWLKEEDKKPEDNKPDYIQLHKEIHEFLQSERKRKEKEREDR